MRASKERNFSFKTIAIMDEKIKQLSKMQVELMWAGMLSDDYNEISEMIGDLKEYMINCPSYYENGNSKHNFISSLKCPNCGAVVKDVQQDSNEQDKEEYCGKCNKQFGYREEITFANNIQNKNKIKQEIRKYWSYKI
jgi:uncharacterized C2H2 Zn-finger protein